MNFTFIVLYIRNYYNNKYSQSNVHRLVMTAATAILVTSTTTTTTILVTFATVISMISVCATSSTTKKVNVQVFAANSFTS